jgi:hypothetical protein
MPAANHSSSKRLLLLLLLLLALALLSVLVVPASGFLKTPEVCVERSRVSGGGAEDDDVEEEKEGEEGLVAHNKSWSVPVREGLLLAAMVCLGCCFLGELALDSFFLRSCSQSDKTVTSNEGKKRYGWRTRGVKGAPVAE